MAKRRIIGVYVQSHTAEIGHVKEATASSHFVPQYATEKVQEVLTNLINNMFPCHIPKSQTISTKKQQVGGIFTETFQPKSSLES